MFSKSSSFVKIFLNIKRKIRIKKRILYLIIMIILLGTLSPAQDKGYGIGIILGEPTGLSGKYWLNKTNALDFGLGFSFTHYNNNRIQLHCDYLWNIYDLFKTSEKFVIYYGPGMKILTGSRNDAKLEIRGVAGIGWFIKDAPLDLFFEAAPVVYLIPGTILKIDGGIGARYYFSH